MKSYRARTAAGTSWQFLLLITLGYAMGIAAKFWVGQINWVLAVYFFNVVCLAFNWIIYYRNIRLDRMKGMLGQLDEEKRLQDQTAKDARRSRKAREALGVQ